MEKQKKLSRRFLGELSYNVIREDWFKDMLVALEEKRLETFPTLRDIRNFHNKHLKCYLRGDKTFTHGGTTYEVKQEYFYI